MRSWVVEPGATSVAELKLVEGDEPRPGPRDVLVRVRAWSLNYRDQMMVVGRYPGPPAQGPVVPLSDGAGEVVAVGDEVTLHKVGDRVASTFFLNWVDGRPSATNGPALGAWPAPGMLSEYVALPEQALVPIARNLSFEEAATLPCAGVTAWNGLAHGIQPVGPGQTVLLLGTGGVSILALQLAHAAGANIVITSSSDEKLERASALGAASTLNYKQNEEWGRATAELVGGGFDKVIEVGGFGTLPQSMQAVGYGGEIAMIGVLTRGGDTTPHILMFKGASLRGILVGSRQMALELNRAIEASDIHPVIDRTFGFEEVKGAFEYQAGPDLFGKVVIAI